MKHKKLPLGFTFSFPVRHEDIDKVSRRRGGEGRNGGNTRKNSAETAFSCSSLTHACRERAQLTLTV